MENQTILRHVVLCKFSDDASPKQVANIVKEFTLLKQKIDEVQTFEYGINSSPENLNDGFMHCFTLSFASETGRDAYLVHPAHSYFVELLKPWLAKILVVDYFASTVL